MFPSKFALSLVFHNFMVFVACMAVLTLTGNPLALLGMFFFREIPLVQENNQPEEREQAIGFTADIN